MIFLPLAKHIYLQQQQQQINKNDKSTDKMTAVLYNLDYALIRHCICMLVYVFVCV